MPTRRSWFGLLGLGWPLGESYEPGEVLVVRKAFETTVLTHWRAPFTDGVRATLTPGTWLVVTDSAGRLATSLTCRAADPDAFDQEHVPQATREHPKYAGHSLVLSRDELARCDRR